MPESGPPVSSDAGAPLAYDKAGDEITIRLGDGTSSLPEAPRARGATEAKARRVHEAMGNPFTGKDAPSGVVRPDGSGFATAG